MPARLTQEQFVTKVKELHPNLDYSLVDYKNTRTPVSVVCPEHGEFTVKPDRLLTGYGCPKCYAPWKRSFESRARKIHGDKYDYPEEYVTSQTKLKIICKEHGEFFLTPSLHLGGTGCPVCSGHKYTTSSFITAATKKHAGRYTYDRTEYVSSTHNLVITCKEHGDFIASPTSHLRGSGCPKCSGRGFSQEERRLMFIDAATKKHDNRYDYSRVVWGGGKGRGSLSFTTKQERP